MPSTFHSSSVSHGDHSDVNIGFIHALVASLAVIIISEIGDKTFFIAAIMAMTHSRLTVFAGAVAALGFMTVLSGMFSLTIIFICLNCFGKFSIYLC